MNTKLLAGLAVVLVIAAGIFVVVRQRQASPHGLIVAPVAAPAAAPPADCLLPGPPPVPPNGLVASEADMRLGHDVMQHFVVELEAYQSCRNGQADHAAAGVGQAQKDKWIEQGNEAVDEANALAASFGAQLKVFKARTPGK